MNEITVCIHGKLAKRGAEDVELVVHSYYVGRPSPCVVIENWMDQYLVGGGIDSVEQIFMYVAARHPGYILKEWITTTAARQQPGEEQTQEDQNLTA